MMSKSELKEFVSLVMSFLLIESQEMKEWLGKYLLNQINLNHGTLSLLTLNVS